MRWIELEEARPWGWRVLEDPRAPLGGLDLEDPDLEARAEAIAAAVGPAMRRRVHDALVALWPENQEAAGRLLDPSSVVIVTGQQPMLLGGPLMVAVKHAGAVHAARALERRLGRPVLPIFWNHAEDHDLFEANRYFIPDRGQSRLLQLRALPAGRCLDAIPLGATHLRTLETWARAGALDALPAERPAGFAAHAWAFHDLNVGPRLRAVRAEPRPLWPAALPAALKLLESHEEAQQALDEGEDTVRSLGGLPQVERASRTQALLFHRDEVGRRRRVLRVAGGFRTVGEPGGTSRTAAQLLESEFSASALARPALTQVILPVLAHAVGPAEAAYFQQAAGLFDLLDVPRPVLLPRPRMVVLNTAAREALDRSGWALDSVLRSRTKEEAADRALTSGLRQSWSEHLSSVAREGDLTADDRQRFDHHFERLLASLHRRLARAPRNAALRRARHHLLEWCRPRGRPQERVHSPRHLFKDLSSLHDSLAAIDPFHRGLHVEESHA